MAPPVSPALLTTAVEGVPVSLVSVLMVVPVVVALATVMAVCPEPLLVVPQMRVPVAALKFR
jgi:hypothetical protein